MLLGVPSHPVQPYRVDAGAHGWFPRGPLWDFRSLFRGQHYRIIDLGDAHDWVNSSSEGGY